ncbi:MAG: penicillin acylase family protein, partial [Pirellulales bacterium]
MTKSPTVSDATYQTPGRDGRAIGSQFPQSAVVRYTFQMERIAAKSARYEFKAARDENGVPHVEAPSWREALYAWGYMHAIDRPTQVYFARAIAGGQATERI